MILFHAALFEVFKGVMLKNKELPCEEEEERAKPSCFKGGSYGSSINYTS